MKKENVNVTIFPPCGENVGLPTKRGANKANFFWPLLPRLTAVLPTQGREITTRGFTLIELLVVVLIIGILAAVALPQYQKAVYKSRFATLKHLTTALSQAQEVYYLANNSYATKIADLDIDMPGGKDPDKSRDNAYFYDWGYCEISSIFTQCRNFQTNMQYQIGLPHAYFSAERNLRKCQVFSPATDFSDTASKVCIMETGDTETKTHASFVTWVYK